MGGLAHGLDDLGAVLVLGGQFGSPLYVRGVPAVGTGQYAVSSVEGAQGNAAGGEHRVTGEVGQDEAVEAPLIAQNVGHQAGISTGPDSAHTGKSVHNSLSAALGDGHLERLEVDLTDGLLVCPGGDAAALGLAVVQGEVLHVNINALGLDAADLSSSDLAGEEAVLGVVLKVTAAVSVAVGIHGGSVEAGSAQIHNIVADALADFFHQFGVESSSHDVLIAVSAVVGGDTGQRLGEALGAVIVQGAGLGNALHHGGVVVALADQLSHLIKGNLVEQLVPIGVIVALANHHAQGHAVVGTHGGHNSVRIGVSGIVAGHVQVGNQSLVGFQGNDLGPGALPVRAGQVVNAVHTVVAGVGIVELVGDGLTGDSGNAVGVLVQAGNIVVPGHIGVAVGGHAVLNGVALGGQHVVDGIVRIVGSGQVVVTGIQDVGLGTVGIVCSQFAAGHVDGNGLGSTRLEDLGLTEAAQFNSGLLDLVLLIVIGVGALEVDLHDLFACHAAGVLDINADIEAVGSGIIAGLKVGPVEGGVAQAIAEGISNIGVVVVIASVALAQDSVLIAGLIVAVADVDALAVDVVVLVAVQHEVIPLSIVVLGSVGVLGAVEVNQRGSGAVVVAVGIDQVAGGVDLAGQDVGNGVQAPGAGVANPQGGVDAVAVIGQEITLHSVGGVDQDDDLIEVLAGHSQQVFLLLCQLQSVGAIGKAIDGHIIHLASQAGDGDDGSIAIGGKAVLDGVGVDIHRNFVDMVVRADVDAGSIGILGGVAGELAAFAGQVEIPQGGVDFQAVGFQGFLQGGSFGGVDVSRAGTAGGDANAGVAQGRDLAASGQGQSTVVLQQDSTLAGELLGDLLVVSFEILDRVEASLEILNTVILANSLVGGGLERDVDSLGTCIGQVGADTGCTESHCRNAGQDAPQDNAAALLLVLCHKSFSFSLFCIKQPRSAVCFQNYTQFALVDFFLVSL